MRSWPNTNRSEGLTPNGIFGPWAWWSRALARWESCWDAAAVAAAAVSWKLGSETVLVFGPESVSYERSRPMNRTILREISARVFFVKIQKIKKNHISNISRISGNSRKHVPKIIQGSTTQPLEPPARRPYFQDTRQSEKPDLQYFQATRKLEKSNFQYFQATRKLEKPDFQYFQDMRKYKISNFQIFPGGQ